jgi:thiamine-phosphate pyrophosphorylase
MKRIGRLHALTDTTLQSRFDHLELAERMLAGGADVIQFREKTAPTRLMIETARRMAEMCRRRGAQLLVNDRVDVAIAADADGVHLGQDDFPVALARELLGPDRIIGASVDTLEEAEAARRDGADYVGFGPIFPTGSKVNTGPVVGLEPLDDLIPKFPLPVVAIGGLDERNVEPVLRAGVHGIAVLSAICRAEDPEAATRSLRRILDRVLQETGGA